MSKEHQAIDLVQDLSSIVQHQQLPEATSQIQYVSAGHCLIIGEVEAALSAGARWGGSGFTVVEIDPTASQLNKRLTNNGVAVFTVPALMLSGYLGAYRALVPTSGAEPLNLAVSVYRETGLFDIVLDLSPMPLLPMRLLPFGYRHVADSDALESAIESLRNMEGEFEKPRYFNYQKNLCAHSRSELKGCSNCLDVCTTDAIQVDGEGIAVDPFLCQGCGSCATVCPSGAISYAYPRPADALQRSRQLMQKQGAHILVLHTEVVQEQVADIAQGDDVLSLLVEEVSAFGPDYWLTMLAGSARQIVVVTDLLLDDPNRQALQAQLDWVTPLLSSLGESELPISFVSSEQLQERLSALRRIDITSCALAERAPQFFATNNDKRQTIRLALDALSQSITPSDDIVKLATGAPFGRITVDTGACTLCMACVSTCPAKALQDGQDTPALRFVEANCLQCGLCESACPESAIQLESRYVWDSVQARQVTTLHEEAPFHCVRCHIPFTTQAMIDTMTEKLAGHWMFQDENALRRLRLCGDCRVRDMFEADAAGIETHKTV